MIVITTSPYDVSQNYFVDFRIYAAEKTIKYIASQFKDILTIVTGPHGSIRPDILLRDTNYLPDIIIQWEYENTLLEIVSRIIKNKDYSIKSIKNIPNLYLKTKSGKYFSTGFSEENAHPTSFPVIFDSEIIKKYIDKYFGDRYVNGKHKKVHRFGTLLLQRGCPYKCKFCFKFFGEKLRSSIDWKQIRSSLEEWLSLGVNDFFVLDYSFTLDQKYVQKLSNILRDYPSIRLSIQTRCDLLTPEILHYLKRSNVSFIWLGIETFDPRIHKLINKYQNINVIYNSIELLLNSDFEFGGFIQFGLPGENLKSMSKTIENISKFKLTYTKSIILHAPLYGTETYKLAEKEYPWIGNNWSDIALVRGLVNNSMTPSLLINTVKLLRRREMLKSNF